MVTFNCLSYGSFPFAKLLLGEEKSFLAPAEVLKLSITSCHKYNVHLLPLGSVVCIV